MFPDLSDLGFTRQAAEALPSGGSGVDAGFAFYSRAQPPMQARIEVHVFPDEKAALADYGTQSQGWKTPPPGLFPQDPKNADSTPLSGFSEAKAYKATVADQSQNLIWTDVFRVGRVVVISHVLGRSDADVDPVRQAIGAKVKANVK